ncbi:hypothetical protein Tco_1211790 [Tanacetum coccineum]
MESGDFKLLLRDRRHDRFTPLIKTPKEILSMVLGKGTFVAPPQMSGTLKRRNKSKYFDFHGNKGHNTYDCLHLKRQIKEVVKLGKLAHLVKGIKQGSNKGSTSKRSKKPDTTSKDKGAAIFMVQSWGRNVCPRGNILALGADTPVAAPPQLVENIKVSFHHEYMEQSMILGGNLPDEGKKTMCEVLMANLDVFIWKPADMTGVPRMLAEHKLGVKKGDPSVRQKEKGQAPEINSKTGGSRIMQEVKYHNWI